MLNSSTDDTMSPRESPYNLTDLEAVQGTRSMKLPDWMRYCVEVGMLMGNSEVLGPGNTPSLACLCLPRTNFSAVSVALGALLINASPREDGVDALRNKIQSLVGKDVVYNRESGPYPAVLERIDSVQDVAVLAVKKGTGKTEFLSSKTESFVTVFGEKHRIESECDGLRIRTPNGKILLSEILNWCDTRSGAKMQLLPAWAEIIKAKSDLVVIEAGRGLSEQLSNADGKRVIVLLGRNRASYSDAAAQFQAFASHHGSAATLSTRSQCPSYINAVFRK